MGNRLYIGNLPYNLSEEQLRAAFAPHGDVVTASVVMDRATGRSRGFGFVEMATAEAAAKATQAMNGALLEGRPLTVNEARERAPRGAGGPGGPRSFDRGGGDRGGFGGDRGGDRGGAPSADRGSDFGGPDRSRGRRERDRSDRDRDGGGGGGRGRW